MTEERTGPRKKGRKIIIAVAFLAVAGILAGGYWFFFMRGIVSTDDARVDGDLLDVAPQIAGTLATINFGEGDRVRKGDVLFTLDARALQVGVDQAQSDVASKDGALAAARAQLSRAVNGPLPDEIKVAEAAMRGAAAELELARIGWERMQTLYAAHTIPEEQRDEARARFETATQVHDAAVKRHEMLRQGTRPEDVAAAKATVEQRAGDLASARAAVARARVNLDYATVVAPFDGFVVRRWLYPAATVSPGTPVLTLLDPATLYISANVKETEVGDVHVGNRVDISVDAYPGLTLRGRVEQILRATNSQFSLIPAQGASGTFIKVTQRVPIRVAIDGSTDHPLSPGLSVELKIRKGSFNSPRTAMNGHD